MPSMTIMRGLPGSGKSTIAASLGADVVISADDFFTDAKGAYAYDGRKIGAAHAWCQEGVRLALMCGLSVVVDNTHTRRWEMQPYIDMARYFGIEPAVVVARGDFQNIHGVPGDVVAKMLDRWED